MENQKEQMTIEQLLKAMAQELGEESETMRLLSQLNEKAVFEHAANKNFAMAGEKIPPRYKLLMSIAISAALGVEKCIDTYTQVALRKGISDDEIVEAILLARFVKGTTTVSTSTSAFKMMIDHKKNG